MIFKGGPRGGRDLKSFSRPNQGGRLLKGKAEKNGQQKSESRLLRPVIPNAQGAAVDIYLCIYMYTYGSLTIYIHILNVYMSLPMYILQTLRGTAASKDY